MRQEREPEDLIEVWTLPEDGQERLRNKSGANRWGFALLLKSFEAEARFPEDAGEVPVPAVSYVAQQVKVPAEEWAAYDWPGRAVKRHRMETRGAFGFRECTGEDQGRLAGWPAVELCGVEPNRDRPAEAAVAEPGGTVRKVICPVAGESMPKAPAEVAAHAPHLDVALSPLRGEYRQGAGRLQPDGVATRGRSGQVSAG